MRDRFWLPTCRQVSRPGLCPIPDVGRGVGCGVGALRAPQGRPRQSVCRWPWGERPGRGLWVLGTAPRPPPRGAGTEHGPCSRAEFPAPCCFPNAHGPGAHRPLRGALGGQGRSGTVREDVCVRCVCGACACVSWKAKEVSTSRTPGPDPAPGAAELSCLQGEPVSWAVRQGFAWCRWPGGHSDSRH